MFRKKPSGIKKPSDIVVFLLFIMLNFCFDLVYIICYACDYIISGFPFMLNFHLLYLLLLFFFLVLLAFFIFGLWFAFTSNHRSSYPTYIYRFFIIFVIYLINIFHIFINVLCIHIHMHIHIRYMLYV